MACALTTQQNRIHSTTSHAHTPLPLTFYCHNTHSTLSHTQSTLTRRLRDHTHSTHTCTPHSHIVHSLGTLHSPSTLHSHTHFPLTCTQVRATIWFTHTSSLRGALSLSLSLPRALTAASRACGWAQLFFFACSVAFSDFSFSFEDRFALYASLAQRTQTDKRDKETETATRRESIINLCT